MAEHRTEGAPAPAAAPAAPEPRSKRGLLRRLSFRRRRRARVGTESAAAEWPSTPPPSPAATLGASRSASTSTCSLDGDARSQRDGSSEQQPAPDGPPPPRTEQAGGDAAPAPTPASDELHRVLLSRLECPVCYLPMAPPIRQCVYGHSVCAGCEARLARCPTCRGAFLAATNATLNAIALAVRLPCRYRACAALLHLADKARHEERCRHREYPCPQSRCSPWTGTMDDLLQHVLREHATDTALVTLNQNTELSYTYSRTKPFEISQMDSGVNRVAKSLLLVESATKGAEGLESKNRKKDNKKDSKENVCEEVLLPRALFRFHLRFDAKLVVLQTALQYVGPPDNCKLFRYKVSIGCRDGSFRLSAWSQTTGEEVDDAVSEGKVLRMDAASFPHVVDADGRFIVRVKVVVCRLPPLVPSVDIDIPLV